jgi:hypothetical protein
MARPLEVVSSKTKDNSRKKYNEHRDWTAGKKIGRPKQTWVLDAHGKLIPNTVTIGAGHWEKVA